MLRVLLLWHRSKTQTNRLAFSPITLHSDHDTPLDLCVNIDDYLSEYCTILYSPQIDSTVRAAIVVHYKSSSLVEASQVKSSQVKSRLIYYCSQDTCTLATVAF
jgi:hypothetical protein